MAVDLEERMTQLNRLNDFIDNSRKKISTILSTLGWDEDNIKQKVCYAFCVLMYANLLHNPSCHWLLVYDITFTYSMRYQLNLKVWIPLFLCTVKILCSPCCLWMQFLNIYFNQYKYFTQPSCVQLTRKFSRDSVHTLLSVVYVTAFCGLFTIRVIPWRVSWNGCSYYVPLLVKTAVAMPPIASIGEDKYRSELWSLCTQAYSYLKLI
jgi:hypothetical protein